MQPMEPIPGFAEHLHNSADSLAAGDLPGAAEHLHSAAQQAEATDSGDLGEGDPAASVPGASPPPSVSAQARALSAVRGNPTTARTFTGLPQIVGRRSGKSGV